jgi:hypothetical protein
MNLCGSVAQRIALGFGLVMVVDYGIAHGSCHLAHLLWIKTQRLATAHRRARKSAAHAAPLSGAANGSERNGTGRKKSKPSQAENLSL